MLQLPMATRAELYAAIATDAIPSLSCPQIALLAVGTESRYFFSEIIRPRCKTVAQNPVHTASLFVSVEFGISINVWSNPN